MPKPDPTEETPTPNRNLDWNKVEKLRLQMMLEVRHMAEYFGVSRITYYNWRKGHENISPVRRVIVDRCLKDMLKVLENGWPPPEVIGAEPKDRLRMLRNRIAELG